MILITILLLVAFLGTMMMPNQIGGGTTFSYSKTNLLKASLPFIIIIGHIYQHTGFGADFKISGVYCVGMFFFISGYGLEKKTTINLRYTVTRIAKVLLPLIVPISIYLTIQYAVANADIASLVKASFLDYSLIVPYSWFFITIILLYVVFFICKRLANKCQRLQIPLITISLCIITALYLHIGLQATYHMSNFAFLAGVIMSKYESNIMMKCDAAKFKILLAVVLIVSLYIALHPFKGSIYFNVFLYSFIAAVILSLIRDFTNRFIEFFKGMSFELYTCQGIAFLLIPYDGGQPIAYGISIISLTIALAWFASRINLSLIKRIQKA